NRSGRALLCSESPAAVERSLAGEGAIGEGFDPGQRDDVTADVRGPEVVLERHTVAGRAPGRGQVPALLERDDVIESAVVDEDGDVGDRGFAQELLVDDRPELFVDEILERTAVLRQGRRVREGVVHKCLDRALVRS